MKPETLRALLERKKRTKVFVVTEGYAVAGFVRRSQVDELPAARLWPFVAWFVGSDGIVVGGEPFGPVALDEGARVTRRVQTHRRHLEGRVVPEAYFEAALALEAEK